MNETEVRELLLRFRMALEWVSEFSTDQNARDRAQAALQAEMVVRGEEEVYEKND